MRVGDSSRRCEEIVKKSRIAPFNATMMMMMMMMMMIINYEGSKNCSFIQCLLVKIDIGELRIS